mmetsp:Transcript_4581/g.11661  ORF Transcript_4581/g.11661 Transcript_4581/m.11661 type:complete len:98 (-) Transcript_4581:131-424(-)
MSATTTNFIDDSATPACLPAFLPSLLPAYDVSFDSAAARGGGGGAAGGGAAGGSSKPFACQLKQAHYVRCVAAQHSTALARAFTSYVRLTCVLLLTN